MVIAILITILEREGRAGNYEIEYNNSSEVRMVTANGISDSGRAGFSVSLEGDFNGDGYSDILIGAPSADPNGLSNSGQTYVVFGTPDPLATYSDSFDLSSLDGSNGFAINGILASDHSGESVSMGGDFNGDGYSDILIGAPLQILIAYLTAGQTYVLFSTQDPLATFFSLVRSVFSQRIKNGFSINGVAINDQSGESVSMGGDFNGDGYSDILIGAPSADPNRLSNSGQTYVVFGTPDPLATYSDSFDLSSLNGSNGFAINGISASDQFWRIVSMGGRFQWRWIL